MATIPGENPARTAEPDAAGWPDRRLAWLTLALLMLGLIASILDRAVINLLIDPIKAEYGLSDTQFGALQSIAFGTFYVLMAIPIGMLADRYQRRLVICIGIGVFSLFSLATGLARNFTQLFVARMGVGAGEASISPAGLSLLSDYFPPDKLGRAVSLLMMSTFIGSSLALVAGGALIGWLDRVHAADPGALLGFAPWQVTIMCVALPGLVLTPLFLLIREPARRGRVADRKLAFPELMRELGKRRTFLVLLIAGMSMASAMTHGVSMWLPALFMRVYAWSPAQTGLWLGLLILVTAVAGSYLAGWLTDRLTQQGKPDGPITVAAVSFLGVGAFGVAAPLMPTAELALACFAPMLFLKPMAFSCAPIALQTVIPNELRAQTSALYFTILNLVGLAAGPLLVGAMTDFAFTGPKDVRYSLAILTAVTVPLMAVLMLLARRPYRALRVGG